MAAEVKRKALIYLVLALVITTLIGAGLPHLEFQPGMPPPSFENNHLVLPPTKSAPPVGVPISAFLEILFAIILAAFMLILIYRLIEGINWKQLLSDLFSLLWKLLVVFAFLFLVLSLLPKSQGPSYVVPLPTPTPIVTAPLGPVPPFLIWLVGISLLGAAVLLGIWMIIGSRRASGPETWELEAEKARQALLAGGDLRDVILRCYQQMSQALQQDQEIAREAFMTTGEFERLLAARGVPHAPVHQLTQLFEAVRYGHWQPNPDDEQRALHSLGAILDYSHEAKQES